MERDRLVQRRHAAKWEPNFSPALPTIFAAVIWLWLLCLTLPCRTTTWRVVRLASFPPLFFLLIRLSFEADYTLGNPLRDLALPTITWSLVCKAVEICLTYASGGPKPIRPFSKNTGRLLGRVDHANPADIEWKAVDYPGTWSLERIIYAFDVFGLRRYGTSLLLPRQGRSLEWSKDALNEWSRYLQAQSCKPNEVPVHGPVRRFGQPEASLIFSAMQVLFIVLGFQWIYALASPSVPTVCVLGLYIPVDSVASKNAWLGCLPFAKRCHLAGIPNSAFALPLATRLALVLCFGGAVCFVTGLVETLILTAVWKPEPATVFLSAFEQPLTAPSISRLWARSWHGMSQRDYTNMASLCPGSQYRVMHVFYVFLWSGTQHSWMFSRLQTPFPTLSSLTSISKSMFDPGMMTFFLSQAAGITLERLVLRALPSDWLRRHPVAFRWSRKLWMIFVLIAPGSYFVDSILKRDLMTKEIMQGFTLPALFQMTQGNIY